MEPKTFSYGSATHLGQIQATEYPLASPCAVYLICHGMLEHFGRYDAFAKFLQQNGFAVFGFDMAGHGVSTTNAPRGYFGSGGFWSLVEDIHSLRKIAQETYPGVPLVLMGHSMGSFLVRAYCAKYAKGLKAAIFMGTSGPQRGKPLLGKCLTAVLPAKTPSMFFRSMTFSGFNKTYQKPCDAFAWVSRDEKAVQAYKADKLRIETFCVRGYRDLSSVIYYVSGSAWFQSVPHDLPMLLISGGDDPVGQHGSGARKIAQKLKESGAKDVSVKVYEGARHEVLNELNRDEVMGDILAWLNGLIPKQE